MCFCASASFTVGSVLAAVGGTTLMKVPHKSLRMIALIPIFFALQQFIEGIVWLQVYEGFSSTTSLGRTMPDMYLFFAWVLWPTFVPLALLIPEKVHWRRVVMILSLMLGLYVSIGDIRFILRTDVTATVVGHSISYGEPFLFEKMMYLIAILPPVMVSSLKRIWLFGALVFVAFIFSNMIYRSTFTSVWCFFAAAISLILYEVLCTANADYGSGEKSHVFLGINK